MEPKHESYNRFIVVFYCVVSGKAWSNEYDQGDDGYRLWLNYTFIENDTQRLLYLRQIANVQLVGQSDTISIIDRELKRPYLHYWEIQLTGRRMFRRATD
ncbi:hypothetical protein [Psychrosphaera algicola]|uniref:Uncharacterized protein n=1 Tax=Psychrosphaera algicola TaxID=3023714 RepID=A0ABT5FIR5_9GAMM|nr:hypothetical protein [Psychrosphaera sp. G1-22]MDC2891077.1 hypothetical protein [Psychrosphaera sp. G1-22]